MTHFSVSISQQNDLHRDRASDHHKSPPRQPRPSVQRVLPQPSCLQWLAAPLDASE